MKIRLDAGHGFDTPGKRSFDGMREYEFNREVAIEARRQLEDYQGVTVSFAHDDNRDVPLNQRTDKANRDNVDVYVSIHANAAGTTWNSASGIETFVYTSKPKEALSLAAYVQNHLIRETGRKNRGVKTADFHVLRETHMTAILVEAGFMTNKEEAALLKTKDYRKKVANAIVKGLVDQYKLKKSASKKSNPTTSSKGTYTIKKGDTFWGIENKLELPNGTLAKLNPSVDANNLKIGQVIKTGEESEERYMFKTGWFREGTKGLYEMEKYLKDHGWDYVKVKEK